MIHTSGLSHQLYRKTPDLYPTMAMTEACCTVSWYLQSKPQLQVRVPDIPVPRGLKAFTQRSHVMNAPFGGRRVPKW